ncbi:MAG: ACP S-malonyltransferase [Phycisphaerae bacterium]|nr:ACP S-malonyltransferase [Phycisphaerae bacterium]
MDKVAVIFPGQGAQVVGMGREMAEAHEPAAAVFEQANDVLGFDLRDLCFNGPPERLSETDLQQPAIFATSVAIWEALRAARPEVAQVAAAGGLSLGEYVALYVAGSISLADGLRAVQQRGRLMQAASQAVPSGMATIIGLDRPAVEEIVAKAREEQVLVVANHLADDLIVISGQTEAVDRACELAEQASARVNPLDVAGAFHSPLMSSAAEGLTPVLDGIEVKTPEIPVVSNVTAGYHDAPSRTRSLLTRQVVRPVEWARSIQRLAADGCRHMLAVGPGSSQRTIIRRVDRSINVSVVDLPGQIEKL